MRMDEYYSIIVLLALCDSTQQFVPPDKIWLIQGILANPNFDN